MNPRAILIVEDNTPDFEIVRRYLESKDFQREIRLTRASTLQQAAEFLSATQFHLVLLDLSLPDSSGLETLKRLLPSAVIPPVIVMTNFKDERTGIEAVKLGAQDYLIKDETTPGLLSRSIAFALERAARSTVDHSPENKVPWHALQEPFTVGPFRIDLEKQTISTTEAEQTRCLSFTPTEFKLFIFLIKNQGEVVSRGQIVAEIWTDGAEGEVSSRTIDKHISDMKRKCPSLESYIESVYGVGYRLNISAPDRA